MAARFWVGTSGWVYPHWRGRFYPLDLPQSRWFGHYAEHFLTVELNNSFYRQPSDRAWDSWRAQAPPGFRFAVKANRFLTHIKRLRDVEDSTHRFLEGARRLGPALGPLLYQLPPNLRVDAGRLRAFLAALPRGLRHAFEFRHGSWFCEEVYAALRQHDAALCLYDMPTFTTPLAATADFAYLRFHGSGLLYASNYPEEELREWAERLRHLAREANLREVYVYFNNDACAYAVGNARTLLQITA